MTAVLKLFWSICLLRSGPEAVPTRTWFVVALIAAQLSLAVFLAGLALPDLPAALAFNVALINLTVLAAIAWFALYIRRFEARFPATLSAALGTKTLIGAATCLAHGVASGLVLTSMMHAFTLWSVVVIGFILHRALACRLWIGVLLSMGTFAFGLIVTGALLGATLTAHVGPSSG